MPLTHFSITLLLTSLLLSGCSMLERDEGLGGTRFYSLTPMSTGSAPFPQPNAQLRLGVGPIGLSRLLRRPQIITRKSETEVAMAEQHQWGGLLKEDISRTLAENFSTLLMTHNIEQYPWKFSFKPHYHVRIDIDQLDGKLGQQVTLKARWRLMKGREEIAIENSIITTSVKGRSYNAYVAAQSEALGLLTREISQKIATW